MFKSILLPIDMAHLSSWKRALPQAVELAAAGHGVLTVITVVRDLNAAFEGTHCSCEVERMISRACDRLGEIVSGYRGRNVLMKEEVRFGSIGYEILSAAREHQIDLIVMASHRPEITDYLLGSNAAYVARHAACSVLVLRQSE